MAIVEPKRIESLIIGCKPTEYDRLRDLLLEVFQRLPQEDAEVLIEERRVRVLLAAISSSIYFPVSHVGDYYLLVLHRDFFNWSHSAQVYTIAHELAHAFMEHKVTSVKVEFLTDKQVLRWGFEAELESAPNNYIRGKGVEQVFGVTITGELSQGKEGD